MNIDNSIGMVLFSNDVSAASVTGNLNGLGNNTAQNPDGSMFQQLISQMLTEKTQMANSAGLETDIGEQGAAAGETGNLLSELLLAGGNLAKVRLQNGEAGIGESTETDDQIIDLISPEDTSAGIAQQAFMAGLSNPMAAANSVTQISEISTVNGAEALEAAGSVKTAAALDLEVPTTKEYRLSTIATDNSMEVTTALTMEKTAEQVVMPTAGNGKTIFNDGNAVQEPEGTAQINTAALGSEKPAPTGNDSVRTVKAEPANGKTEAISGQDFNLAGLESKLETAAAGSQMTETAAEAIHAEDTAGAAEKSKHEMDPKSIDLERTGFQNSIQGAVAAREAAETIPASQGVETSQPYSQIKDEILTRLEKSGPTEFKMQLDPEDLGQIDIKLKLSEGKLIIDILAANSKTQAMLSGQVDKLIASMGLQNVMVESVQVNQQMNSQTQDNGQGQGQGYAMNAAMDFSQRKQQEQYQQQFHNDGKLAGTFSRQPDETQTDNLANRIESMRYNFNRMNYAV